MSNLYTDCFKVRCHETDRNGNLKLRTWFDYLQESAANHAAQLGFGFDDLNQRQLIWVLSRIRLQIFRPQIGIGETLKVQTWPSQFKRLFAHREFNVSDSSGQTVGRASSAWLLLQTPRLRPVDPAANLPGTMPDNSELPVYFPLEDKLAPSQLPTLFPIPIRASIEDVNGHLNNAEYAGFIQDAGAQLNENCPPLFQMIELHFLAAARAPETLTICAARDGSALHVSGLRPEGKCAFTAQALIHNG